MPLAFESLSHGTVPFGFFNIDSDTLLLDRYFFFAGAGKTVCAPSMFGTWRRPPARAPACFSLVFPFQRKKNQGLEKPKGLQTGSDPVVGGNG